jgi:hypothetical protein
MTGPSIEQLVANRWAEPLAADDAEVLGLWHRAIESFDDSTAPRMSRTGQFKQLYDAVRHGVVAFNAARVIPVADGQERRMPHTAGPPSPRRRTS